MPDPVRYIHSPYVGDKVFANFLHPREKPPISKSERPNLIEEFIHSGHELWPVLPPNLLRTYAFLPTTVNNISLQKGIWALAAEYAGLARESEFHVNQASNYALRFMFPGGDSKVASLTFLYIVIFTNISHLANMELRPSSMLFAIIVNVWGLFCHIHVRVVYLHQFLS